MVRRSPLLSPAGLVVLLLAHAAPTALVAQAADSAPLHLAGIVLNSITGKPVGHALVASLDNRLATLTDDEGRFAFDLAPSPSGEQQSPATSSRFARANLIQLQARKPGFLGDGFGLVSLKAAGSEAGPATFANWAYAPVQSVDHVELRLTPAAVLAGTVSADTTDTAAGVEVILLRHRVQDGERTWTQINRQTTSGSGTFRFAGLEPGEYTVMTDEWRGDRPLPTEPGAITQQYPPVFLGDTATLTPAGLLRIQAGETAQADLHLRASTYFPVTVPIAPSAGWVNVQVVGPDALSQYSLGYNNRDRALTGALPNGDYTLLLTGAPEGFGRRALSTFASLPLHIAGAPVHASPAVLATPGSTTVHVHKEFSRDHTDAGGNFNVNITLHPETISRGYAGGSNQPGNLEEFSLQNVLPGRYRVTAQVYPGYVSALSSGGTDLRREPLVVGPGGSAEAIHITVRDDAATLTGSVTTPDGQPPSRCSVLLLPSGNAGQMQESFAGPDHTFTFGNLEPGTYRLLAFTGNKRPQIAWREPDTLRALEGEGTTFTIAAGENLRKDVTPTDPPAGDL